MQDSRVEDLIGADDSDEVAVDFIGGCKVGENSFSSWTYNQVSPAPNTNAGAAPV